MSEAKRTHVIRPKEVRAAEVDKKIEYHKDKIKKLEAKKSAILSARKPRTKRVGAATVAKTIKEQKVDPLKALDALRAAGLVK